MRRSHSVIAFLALAGTLAAASAHAQVYVAPQPGYPPYGGAPYGQNGPYNPYGPNNPYGMGPGRGGRFGRNNNGPNGYNPNGYNPNGNGPNGNGPNGGQTSYLPDGVDHMYALEGTNQILLYGTQKGYDTVKQLIKGLQGDWNITRTQVVQVREKPSYLTTLGVTPSKDGTYSAADVQKLLKARQDGKLTASQTVQIHSGDDEETDTTLGLQGLPLSLTTHINSGSAIQLSLTAPLTTTLTLTPGQTTVVATPVTDPKSDDVMTLLFLTPTIQENG